MPERRKFRVPRRKVTVGELVPVTTQKKYLISYESSTAQVGCRSDVDDDYNFWYRNVDEYRKTLTTNILFVKDIALQKNVVARD